MALDLCTNRGREELLVWAIIGGVVVAILIGEVLLAPP